MRGSRRSLATDCGAALDRFVRGDPGRSIAIESIAGPPLRQARGERVIRPAASLLKLPLVVAVLEAARRGSLCLDEPVRHHELPESHFPSVIDVLDPAHVFTIRELCGLTLATSDNPVAQYLLMLVGREAVSAVLHDLGCSDSTFVVGFDDEMLGSRGRANVSTASDMMRVLRSVHDEGHLAGALVAMESSFHGTRIPLRVRQDERNRVAHKSGSLAGVCNDMGVIRRDHHALGVVVLCDQQGDVARTGIEIGDCVAEVWRAFTD